MRHAVSICATLQAYSFITELHHANYKSYRTNSIAAGSQSHGERNIMKQAESEIEARSTRIPGGGTILKNMRPGTPNRVTHGGAASSI